MYTITVHTLQDQGMADTITVHTLQDQGKRIMSRLDP